MEAILAFFNTIKLHLKRANDWLAAKLDAAFYALGTKLLGQERIDSFLLNTRARYQSSQRWWANAVDTHSAYYRPIARLWKIFGWGFSLAVFYIFCVETNFLWLMGGMPSVEDLQNPKVNQSSEIYTSDGIMIGKFYTENRTPVGYDQISPNIIEALVATEDERFYEHSGIDLRAMGRVAVGLLTGSTDQGGGSTVTQQLAKKLFKTRRRDARGLLGGIPVLGTLVFKTKEWLTAIKLERNFTKEEIITMYLNTVDYGNNAYGINTAARSYFSKSPDSLSVQEAAVLVGLQKATTTYNPIRNPDRSLERRNVVLGRMANFNYLTQAEADSISQLPIELSVKFETPYDGNANYFKNAVVDYVKKWGEENGYDLYTDGLKIYTTIDSRMQEHAEKALETKMRDLQKTFEQHWGRENPWRDEDGKEIPNFLEDVIQRTGRYKALAAKFPNQPDSVSFYLNKKDTMTVYDWKSGGAMVRVWSSMDSLEYYKRIMRAGMMAMEPQTGYIKAWVGGLDYNFFKYDHVKQGKRQPGSTFKPFVYTTGYRRYNLQYDALRPHRGQALRPRNDDRWQNAEVGSPQLKWLFYLLQHDLAAGAGAIGQLDHGATHRKSGPQRRGALRRKNGHQHPAAGRDGNRAGNFRCFTLRHGGGLLDFCQFGYLHHPRFGHAHRGSARGDHRGVCPRAPSGHSTRISFSDAAHAERRH